MQRLIWRQAALARASARFCASSSSSASASRSFVSSSPASRVSRAAATRATTPISSPTYRSSTRRAYSSQPPPNPNPNQSVKFWPFLIIIAAGFGGYVFLVKRRIGKFIFITTCFVTASHIRSAVQIHEICFISQERYMPRPTYHDLKQFLGGGFLSLRITSGGGGFRQQKLI